MTAELPLYERDPEAYRAWLAEGNKTQPRKRVSADLLIRDRDGSILVVDPEYKRGWDLPGGMVEANEPPVDAVRRELDEELGLAVTPRGLLCVDWVAPRDPWDDLLSFIFDGGVLDDPELVCISDSELQAAEFCPPDEALRRLPDRTARRLAHALQALGEGRARYLHDGHVVMGQARSVPGPRTAAAELGADTAGLIDSGEPWSPDTALDPSPAPMNGIWLSEYEYPSTSRGRSFRSTHYVVVTQRDSQVQVRSVPDSPSRVRIDMTLNGRVLNGTWAEETSRDGHYGGAVYYGAIHMTGDPAGQYLGGRWLGFGKHGENNEGQWSLMRLTSGVSAELIEQYSSSSPPGRA